MTGGEPEGMAEKGATRVFVAVSDTGPGIPDEKRSLLFEEFTRLDPDASEGAGVGLAISRRIAMALDGDISVETAVGRGSTFTLWLPLRRPGHGRGRPQGASPDSHALSG